MYPTPVFLAGASHRTEEPDRLQFMGSQRVRHDLATGHACTLLATADMDIKTVITVFCQINVKLNRDSGVTLSLSYI